MAKVIVAVWTILVVGYITSQTAQGLTRYCQSLDCPRLHRIVLPVVGR